MLARIPVEDVFDAVTARLDSDKQEEPQRISLDAMNPHALASLGDVERIGELPIPHPDFALDRIALTRATDDLEPILKEAFRVLRPGGTLYLASGRCSAWDELLLQCGFLPSPVCKADEPLVCEKSDTWPRPHVAIPPPLTQAASTR